MQVKRRFWEMSDQTSLFPLTLVVYLSMRTALEKHPIDVSENLVKSNSTTIILERMKT